MRIPQRVALLHAERPGGRSGKSGRVEPGRAGGERRPRDGRIGDDIPELVATARSDAGEIVAAANRERRARLELVDARELPMAERARRRRVAAQEGQFVDPVGDQHVRAIEIRDGPVGGIVVGVRQHVGERRGIVHRAREGVADAGVQAVGHPPLDAHLQPVVLRSTRVLGQADRSVAQIRPQGIGIHAGIGLQRARRQLIDIALALVVQPAPADVPDLDAGLQRQLALNGKVPVPGARHVED